MYQHVLLPTSPFPFPPPSPRCCLTRNPFFIPLPRACKSLTCTFRNLHYNAALSSLLSLSLFHHDATIYVYDESALFDPEFQRYRREREGDAMTCETERRRSRKRTKRKSLAGGRRDSGTGSAASRPHYAYECKFLFASLRAGIYLSRTRGRIQPRTVWNIRERLAVSARASCLTSNSSFSSATSTAAPRRRRRRRRLSLSYSLLPLPFSSSSFSSLEFPSDLGDRVPCHNYLPPSSRSGTFVRRIAPPLLHHRPMLLSLVFFY